MKKREDEEERTSRPRHVSTECMSCMGGAAVRQLHTLPGMFLCCLTCRGSAPGMSPEPQEGQERSRGCGRFETQAIGQLGHRSALRASSSAQPAPRSVCCRWPPTRNPHVKFTIPPCIRAFLAPYLRVSVLSAMPPSSLLGSTSIRQRTPEHTAATAQSESCAPTCIRQTGDGHGGEGTKTESTECCLVSRRSAARAAHYGAAACSRKNAGIGVPEEAS